MKKFSIIMTVYRELNCLREVIDSVLKQGENNFELIIVLRRVNECEEKLKQFQKLDKRIIFLWEEDRGASSAKNLALSKCTGEYIIFIEANEKLLKGTLKGIEQVIKNNPVELLVFDTTKEELLKNLNLHNKVFKRDILEYMHFDEDIHYREDVPFFMEALLKSEKRIFIEKPFCKFKVPRISLEEYRKYGCMILKESIKSLEKTLEEIDINFNREVYNINIFKLKYFNYTMEKDIWKAYENTLKENRKDLDIVNEGVNLINEMVTNLEDRIIVNSNVLRRFTFKNLYEFFPQYILLEEKDRRHLNNIFTYIFIRDKGCTSSDYEKAREYIKEFIEKPNRKILAKYLLEDWLLEKF